jgi:hypothetical protein
MSQAMTQSNIARLAAATEGATATATAGASGASGGGMSASDKEKKLAANGMGTGSATSSQAKAKFNIAAAGERETGEKLSEIGLEMMKVIPIKTRGFFLREFKRCFIGKEAVHTSQSPINTHSLTHSYHTGTLDDSSGARIRSHACDAHWE